MRVIQTIAAASVAFPVFIPFAAAAADSCPPLTQVSSVDTVTGPGGFMLVPVRFGESTKLMLFDSGRFTSTITPAAVKELNIPTYQAGRTYTSGFFISDSDGNVSHRYARFPSVTIGNQVLKQMSYMLMPTDLPVEMQAGGIAGYLAPAPNIDIDLDFVGHKLSFFSTEHCEGKVVYWPAEKVAMVPMNVPRTQLSFETIVIPVQLDGKLLDARIDTGSADSMLNLSAAQDQLGIDQNSPGVEEKGHIGKDAAAKTYMKRFSALSFNGVIVSNPVLVLWPDKEIATEFRGQRPVGSVPRPQRTGPDMTIGMDVLSKLHIYVAYKERKLYLTAAAAPGNVPINAVSKPAAPGFNIAGSWKVDSQLVAPACDVRQSGGTLAGTCTGPQGTGELSGTVAGDAIRWQWKRVANTDSAPMLLNFSGTMPAAGKIAGFVESNGRTSGFSATRQ